MLYKSFVFLFVMMPFFVMSQSSSSSWSLFLNGTKLLSSSVDSVASVQLSKKIKGEIKIAFAERDIRFIRTVLMMNTTRQTFLQKKMTTNKSVSFSVADVLDKSKAKPFVIYIVDVPADTKKLMGIRIMPVAICKVEWKE